MVRVEEGNAEEGAEEGPEEPLEKMGKVVERFGICQTAGKERCWTGRERESCHHNQVLIIRNFS